MTFVVGNQDCTRRMILDKFVPEPDKPKSAEALPEGDAPEVEPPLSPERTAVLSDLHWLVHQGHVVEYANGQMEIAPKPQQLQPKKKKPKPDKKLKAETPTVTEAPADASATEEAKPAEPPASETSDTTEPPEPNQATEPTEPVELAETSTAVEESPAQDDSPSEEVPAKVAE